MRVCPNSSEFPYRLLRFADGNLNWSISFSNLISEAAILDANTQGSGRVRPRTVIDCKSSQEWLLPLNKKSSSRGAHRSVSVRMQDIARNEPIHSINFDRYRT